MAITIGSLPLIYLIRARSPEPGRFRVA